MVTRFIDLPNKGKAIGVSKLSELKSDSIEMLQLLSKDNQGGLIIDESTGKAYTFVTTTGATRSLKVVPVDGVYMYTYDFATNGGAVGAIELDGPELVGPVDVIDGYYDVTTAFTSGGAAQISLGTSASATTNLKGAAVLGTNGTAGRKILVPDFHANGITNIVDVSADGQPVINVTVADLTAGALELFLITKQRLN